MSSDLQLTLGALYREMRAGLGDTGRVRVTVEFLQRTIAVAGEAETAEPASLVLETLLEYEDRVLDRAQIALRGSGGPPLRFMVARHGDAYAYSLDGGVRWGRVAAHPRIFSLEEFERELAEIPVEDATYDVLDAVRAGEPPPVSEPHPGGGPPPLPERFVDALDVSLDRGAFLRLLPRLLRGRRRRSRRTSPQRLLGERGGRGRRRAPLLVVTERHRLRDRRHPSQGPVQRVDPGGRAGR